METKTDYQTELEIDVVITESISKTIKKKIALPYYSQYEKKYYKITGRGDYSTLRVVVNGGWCQLDCGHNFNDAIRGEECTKEEFEQVCEKAKQNLLNF